MEHATEIEGIKKELRTTQDSVLLIHQDLKQMSRGIIEMSASMKIMVEVQSDMRLMNERAESRYLAQKSTNERLDLRIDKTEKTIQDKSELVEKRAERGYSLWDNKVDRHISWFTTTSICGRFMAICNSTTRS